MTEGSESQQQAMIGPEIPENLAENKIEMADESNANGIPHYDKSSGGNEDRKIFVGGISYDTTNEDLQAYFNQYGEVAQAQVKFDRTTGRSRGFAFVEFGSAGSCKLAQASKAQTIKGKQVEVKPAKSRENKKVFVGGLPSDYPEEDLKNHFEAYGKVEDVEWPWDRQRNARRNFAFVVFEEEDGADRASAEQKQRFGERMCDVKKAVPQNKRFPPMGMMPTGRGAFMGARGGRGGAAGYGWGGAPGMGNWNYGGSGWGDWYGAGAGAGAAGAAAAANAAAAGYYGNYYGGGGAGGAGGYGGGYYDDYASNNYAADYWSGWGQYSAGAAGAGGAGYDAYGQPQTGAAGATQPQQAGRGRFQPY